MEKILAAGRKAVVMDMADYKNINFFIPAPFITFSGRVPKPIVKLEQGGPVAETEITKNDVLLGRGSAVDNHYGNIQFRYIILQTATNKCNKAYKRNEKTFEAARIVAIIRNLSPPGRFLSKNLKTGCWEEVGDLKARQKVAQAFRDFNCAALKQTFARTDHQPKNVPHYHQSKENISAPGQITNVPTSSNVLHAVRGRQTLEVGQEFQLIPTNICRNNFLLGRGTNIHNGNIQFCHRVPQNLASYYGHPYMTKKETQVAANIGVVIKNLDPPRWIYVKK